MKKYTLVMRHQYQADFYWDGSKADLLEHLAGDHPKFHNEVIGPHIRQMRILGDGDVIREGFAVFDDDELIFGSSLSGTPAHRWRTIEKIREDMETHLLMQHWNNPEEKN